MGSIRRSVSFKGAEVSKAVGRHTGSVPEIAAASPKQDGKPDRGAIGHYTVQVLGYAGEAPWLLVLSALALPFILLFARPLTRLIRKFREA